MDDIRDLQLTVCQLKLERAALKRIIAALLVIVESNELEVRGVVDDDMVMYRLSPRDYY